MSTIMPRSQIRLGAVTGSLSAISDVANAALADAQRSSNVAANQINANNIQISDCHIQGTSSGLGGIHLSNINVAVISNNEISGFTNQNAGFGIGTVGDGPVYRDYINLVCACASVPAVSTGYSAVNVTMLVMNTSLAQ